MSLDLLQAFFDNMEDTTDGASSNGESCLEAPSASPQMTDMNKNMTISSPVEIEQILFDSPSKKKLLEMEDFSSVDTEQGSARDASEDASLLKVDEYSDEEDLKGDQYCPGVLGIIQEETPSGSLKSGSFPDLPEENINGAQMNGDEKRFCNGELNSEGTDADFERSLKPGLELEIDSQSSVTNGHHHKADDDADFKQTSSEEASPSEEVLSQDPQGTHFEQSKDPEEPTEDDQTCEDAPLRPFEGLDEGKQEVITEIDVAHDGNEAQDALSPMSETSQDSVIANPQLAETEDNLVSEEEKNEEDVEDDDDSALPDAASDMPEDSGDVDPIPDYKDVEDLDATKPDDAEQSFAATEGVECESNLEAVNANKRDGLSGENADLVNLESGDSNLASGDLESDSVANTREVDQSENKQNSDTLEQPCVEENNSSLLELNSTELLDRTVASDEEPLGTMNSEEQTHEQDTPMDSAELIALDTLASEVCDRSLDKLGVITTPVDDLDEKISSPTSETVAEPEQAYTVEGEETRSPVVSPTPDETPDDEDEQEPAYHAEETPDEEPEMETDEVREEISHLAFKGSQSNSCLQVSKETDVAVTEDPLPEEKEPDADSEDIQEGADDVEDVDRTEESAPGVEAEQPTETEVEVPESEPEDVADEASEAGDPEDVQDVEDSKSQLEEEEEEGVESIEVPEVSSDVERDAEEGDATSEVDDVEPSNVESGNEENAVDTKDIGPQIVESSQETVPPNVADQESGEIGEEEKEQSDNEIPEEQSQEAVDDINDAEYAAKAITSDVAEVADPQDSNLLLESSLPADQYSEEEPKESLEEHESKLPLESEVDDAVRGDNSEDVPLEDESKTAFDALQNQPEDYEVSQAEEKAVAEDFNDGSKEAEIPSEPVAPADDSQLSQTEIPDSSKAEDEKEEAVDANSMTQTDHQIPEVCEPIKETGVGAQSDEVPQEYSETGTELINEDAAHDDVPAEEPCPELESKEPADSDVTVEEPEKPRESQDYDDDKELAPATAGLEPKDELCVELENQACSDQVEANVDSELGKEDDSHPEELEGEPQSEEAASHTPAALQPEVEQISAPAEEKQVEQQKDNATFANVPPEKEVDIESKESQEAKDVDITPHPEKQFIEEMPAAESEEPEAPGIEELDNTSSDLVEEKSKEDSCTIAEASNDVEAKVDMDTKVADDEQLAAADEVQNVESVPQELLASAVETPEVEVEAENDAEDVALPQTEQTSSLSESPLEPEKDVAETVPLDVSPEASTDVFESATVESTEDASDVSAEPQEPVLEQTEKEDLPQKEPEKSEVTPEPVLNDETTAEDEKESVPDVAEPPAEDVTPEVQPPAAEEPVATPELNVEESEKELVESDKVSSIEEPQPTSDKRSEAEATSEAEVLPSQDLPNEAVAESAEPSVEKSLESETPAVEPKPAAKPEAEKTAVKTKTPAKPTVEAKKPLSATKATPPATKTAATKAAPAKPIASKPAVSSAGVKLSSSSTAAAAKPKAPATKEPAKPTTAAKAASTAKPAAVKPSTTPRTSLTATKPASSTPAATKTATSASKPSVATKPATSTAATRPATAKATTSVTGSTKTSTTTTTATARKSSATPTTSTAKPATSAPDSRRGSGASTTSAKAGDAAKPAVGVTKVAATKPATSTTSTTSTTKPKVGSARASTTSTASAPAAKPAVRASMPATLPGKDLKAAPAKKDTPAAATKPVSASNSRPSATKPVVSTTKTSTSTSASKAAATAKPADAKLTNGKTSTSSTVRKTATAPSAK